MKQQKRKKKKKAGEPKQPVANAPDQRADQADFGGLPKRDLKKYLGCG
jgi:hypothetical protein